MKLRWVLILHLLFFGGWGAYLLTSHRGAQEVWLNTEPVDPRDYLSGNYVALRFPMNRGENPPCARATPPEGVRFVYLRLEPSGETRATKDFGTVPLWHATQCQDVVPVPKPNEVWIRGTWGTAQWQGAGALNFGIERYYVSETSPLRTVRSGQVVARISVNAAFVGRIEALALLP